MIHDNISSRLNSLIRRFVKVIIFIDQALACAKINHYKFYFFIHTTCNTYNNIIQRYFNINLYTCGHVLNIRPYQSYHNNNSITVVQISRSRLSVFFFFFITRISAHHNIYTCGERKFYRKNYSEVNCTRFINIM